jgi:signal transduction histidine kinase
MIKIATGPEQIADKFMPQGVGLSEIKTERLYVLMIIGMSFFGSLLFLMNYLLQLFDIAYMCGTFTLGSIAYLWLFKNGFTIASKLIAHMHVVVVILTVTIIYSEHVFIWTFLIPLTISALVVFTQRQRPFSYIVIAAAFLSLPLYAFIHNNNNTYLVHEPVMHIAWIVNLTGSLVFSVFIVVTLVRLNDTISKELRSRSTENAHQNRILLGSIRTRDKLLSMMSHDLRGDIGKTIGVIDVIERIPLEETEKANLLSNLKHDAERTLEVLDNMLQWCRTQQDELNCNNTTYEVDVLIHQLVSQAEYNLNTKSILLHLNVPKHLKIDVDHTMIESVFRNLLSNSIKFTPINGVISISAKSLEEEVEFTIQDSGVGMTSEQIDNILKGVQFTTRGTNREKGRGFGMVLATEFLNKHKSKLHIESTLGKGTTFSFKLPMASEN